MNKKKKKLITAFLNFIKNNYPELLEEETKIPFNDGDYYYYVDQDNDVSQSIWKNAPIDKKRWSIGNAFKLITEGNYKVQKLKILHELQEMGRPFILERRNYYISTKNNEVSVASDYHLQSCYFDCYFDTQEDAWQAVDKIGKDRLKLYLFGLGKTFSPTRGNNPNPKQTREI